MKIRSGFVSNSSSSSFILATKRTLPKEQIVAVILKHFKVPEDSPLYSLVKDLAEVFLDNHSIDDLDDEEQVETIKQYKDLFKKGFTVYKGELHTDGGYLEEALTNVNINIETDELILKSDGSF